jgi:hypothetical protein
MTPQKEKLEDGMDGGKRRISGLSPNNSQKD